VLALLLGASCDQNLRLVVVEQGGGSGGSVFEPEGGMAGGVVVIPSAGTSPSEGGSLEPGGGSAGGGTPDAIGGEGGAPAGAIWDARPRYTASFVSHQFPGRYIRYVDDKGFIANIDLMSPASDKEAATFDMIPGLFDKKCATFRALGQTATVFRHSGSRIYRHPAVDEPLFLADATFCEEAGMADPAGVTFRSVNYPQRVIHLRNLDELWIDDVPEAPIPATFASESTFYKESAWTERGSP
jgi:hypothetical protein